MSKTLLLDADILNYKVSCVNEFNIEWGEEIMSTAEQAEIAKSDIEDDITRLLADTECADAVLCFSCPSDENFRYKVLPSYKHNRIDTVKPHLLREIKDWCFENYICKSKPHLEGDDVMGILATLHPDKYVIASIDKDLKQIPGLHYDWKSKTFYEVTQKAGDLWFYTQVLTGDTTDGYRGCPNIGPKKANVILQTALLDECPAPGHYWRAVRDTYISKGLTEEDALVQARVAKILTKDDYNFTTQEVKLWSPQYLYTCS
jgi:DNA polymerase I